MKPGPDITAACPGIGCFLTHMSSPKCPDDSSTAPGNVKREALDVAILSDVEVRVTALGGACKAILVTCTQMHGLPPHHTW